MFEITNTPVVVAAGSKRHPKKTDYESVSQAATDLSGTDDAPKDEATSDSQHVDRTQPEFKYCSFCEKQVLSTVETQSSVWCFLLGCFLFLFCGWIAFCVLPFAWPLLQTVVHSCPICNTVLEKRSRVSCVKLREEVITIRIGSCAIVLSRTYVIVSLLMLGLLFTTIGARWFLNFYGLPDINKGEFSGASWEEFLQDCGSHSYLGNPVQAERRFSEKYDGRTVLWAGRMHHIQEGIWGKNFLYMNMEPRLYHRTDFRDLALVFGKSLFEKASELNVGDRISLEATLLQLGKRGRPILGYLWDFNVTAKAEDLPSLEEESRSLVIIRNQLRTPPIDILNLIRLMRQGQENLKEKQDNSDTFNILIPFGDLDTPIHVIQHPSHSEEDVGEENDDT